MDHMTLKQASHKWGKSEIDAKQKAVTEQGEVNYEKNADC